MAKCGPSVMWLLIALAVAVSRAQVPQMPDATLPVEPIVADGALPLEALEPVEGAVEVPMPEAGAPVGGGLEATQLPEELVEAPMPEAGAPVEGGPDWLEYWGPNLTMTPADVALVAQAKRDVARLRRELQAFRAEQRAQLAVAAAPTAAPPVSAPPVPPPNLPRNLKRGHCIWHWDWEARDMLQTHSPNGRSRSSWWYNWGPDVDNQRTAASWARAHTPSPIEFVPMQWGAAGLSNLTNRMAEVMQLMPHTKYLLGFNEPDGLLSSNVTFQEGAWYWHILEDAASRFGLKLVTPALAKVTWLPNFINLCDSYYCNEVQFSGRTGSGSRCRMGHHCKDCLTPTGALKPNGSRGCTFSYIALHLSTCNNVDDFKYWVWNKGIKYGLPVWLTEFGCAYRSYPNPLPSMYSWNATIANMRQALDYVDSEPWVFRYSWFSQTTYARQSAFPYNALFHYDHLEEYSYKPWSALNFTPTGRAYERRYRDF